ncbi:tRNA pseudouridine(38-40) synthase TruA [Phorcysia thermohydrogeniphila]|uniref:tRNA pseudouridine synthase A n=1 Tax=Phorcysia thermohydrogeniphila TaxID=936138 RepID=A0A4R1GEM6_9BACT|nr:tRNA pseudouridine(38-40) synthase TruA [Phorcysia thermohydrogeniphila]TCK06428.1 tRNA pseudouridine38-40 synthase [Phorcysia thermohydrogeniphila]
MRNVKLTIEYLGTNYYGWQILPGKPTVAGKITEVVEKILNHPVKLTGASRTDAGVHALGQVANFKTEKDIPLYKIQLALNGLLPPDIKIVNVEEVPLDFDARRSAQGKRYRYRVFNRKVPSPFEYKRAWFLPYELDFDAMEEAKKYLIGTYDFTSFSKADKRKQVNPVRTVNAIEILKKGDVVEFVFFGKSFLRHMVRVMTAVLVEVGKGRLRPEDVEFIREKRDRTFAPFLAPPDGLYLEKVYYGDYPY